jgi:hypothetical protein
MPRKILILIAAVSLLTTFRSRLVQIQWAQGGWVSESPQVAVPFVPDLESDLDSDGDPEQIVLLDRHVSIENRDRVIWTSPPEWKIRMVQITDLTRDGQPEVALLVWRPFAPWPVDAWLPQGGRIEDFHNAENQSCHIILFGWSGEKYREIWAGSALAEPILAFFAADWNGDGRQELAAVETGYASPLQGRAIALWEWNGFGFSIIHRMNVEMGAFVFLLDGNGMPSLLFDPASWFFDPRR